MKTLAPGDDPALTGGESTHLSVEVTSVQEEGDARDKAVEARSEREGGTMEELRDANEHLVIATMKAQARAEAAERGNRHREQFLAMLAHELRNPLAPIVNALAVLHRVATPEPLVPWAHDVIKRQVNHM
ncbi:MAG: histidine kinase dimerization/phospho-acceptor domain-containing protein, partial [Burkholderiales bacterium]